MSFPPVGQAFGRFMLVEHAAGRSTPVEQRAARTMLVE
jgi:hypothetical protein